MKTFRLLAIASGLALMLPVSGMAQDIDTLQEMSPEERREYVQGLSDDERQALRDQQKARWDAMSDEERDTVRRDMRERRDLNRSAMREQWDSMSDEEREAARAKQREMKEQRRETWNNMSDEEKAAARENMRGKRDEARGKRGKGDKRDRKRDGQGPQQ